MPLILQRLGWLVATACFSAVLSGCGKQGAEMNANWSGGLITKQGNYTLASSKQTVAVWVDKEHLVRYSITDAAGKTLFVTSERASAYDKWLLCYDAKG